MFGNGINLLGGGRTWNELLLDISEKQFMPPISSNTLKYEYIILPQDEITDVNVVTSDGHHIKTSDGKLWSVIVNTENNLKRNLCLELKKQAPSYFYSKLANLKANHFITTNYELFLNKIFIDIGYSKKTICDNDNKLYNHEVFESNDHTVSVWNIHGDVKHEPSIMLGLSDYCKYVSAIDTYLNSSVDKSERCWIDLLFNSDVYILGLGMAYEEIDIWNVLTTRMRLKRKDKSSCNNHIYYYAIQDESFDTGKKKLLEAMGVEVVDVALDGSDKAYVNAYENIYKHLFDLINK